MKNQYFEKVENKFVFNLSRIFWHFFIAIGTLAIVAGIGVLAYSIIPVFKNKVSKAAYPPEVQVTLSDIAEPVAPAQVNTQTVTTTSTAAITTPPPAQVVVSTDPDKSGYDLLVKQLQQLIPPAKYTWEGSGHFEYPYGQNYALYYPNNPKYKVYVKTGGGVIDNLNGVYERTDCYSYKNKTALLQSYINILKVLNEEDRMAWLNNLISYTGNNLKNAIDLFTKLSISASKFPKTDLSYLHTLVSFRQQNKNDGAPFINMVNDLITKFDIQHRVEVLNVLVDAHNYSFNNNVSQQRQLTESFITLITHFTGEQQPRALAKYYRVYLGKNRERETTIAEINTNFTLETAQAEIAYQAKKTAKQTLRLQSIISIGAGIAFVSIIAILLVFLAIQRSVRQIEEKINA
ncbi:MAG TPA: hypothetical protein PLW44_00835 [Chitinophagales bacterium]|nr:hypothetical protein [Chitinophagales bacterium]